MTSRRTALRDAVGTRPRPTGAPLTAFGRQIAAANDLGCLSDPLGSGPGDLSERRQASWLRPNALRALRRPEVGDRILEVGAGYGTVTRWLAESGAAVDALEPDAAHADTAMRRCDDLEDAWVLAAHLPATALAPDYDLVVDLDGLAHAGAGSSDPAPYVERLRRLADHASADGTLVLGVANRLGAPALAGAPDPFTGRSWDGPNEYPAAPPARGFSRAELERLLAMAGLEATVLSVAPDVVAARMVHADELFDHGASAAALAWQVPDHAPWDPTADGPDPRRLWRSLVDAGHGRDAAPGFLVLASRSGAHTRWWPKGQLGSFWSMQRRSRFCAQTRIVVDEVHEHVEHQAADVRLERQAMATGDVAPVDEGPLRFRPDSSPLLAGVSLQELLAGCAGVDAAAEVVRCHAGAVAGLRPDAEGRLPVDAVPFNLLVFANGDLAWIDQEWWLAGVTRQDVLGRGLLVATLRLASAGTVARWGGGTVGEVALALGRFAGLEQDDWLARAIVLDAAVQLQVCHRAPQAADAADVARALRTGLVGLLQSRLPGPGAVGVPRGDDVVPAPADGDGFRLGRR